MHSASSLIKPTDPSRKTLPKKPVSSPSRRVHINLPLYAIKEMKDRATREDVTLRFIVLTALRASGVTIKDVDMIEDGRRVSQ